MFNNTRGIIISLIIVLGFSRENSNSDRLFEINNNWGFGAYDLTDPTNCVTDDQYEIIKSKLITNRDSLTTIGVITINSRIPTDFTWPLQAAEHFNYNDYWAISGFVDNNPTYGNIVDYNCGMRTYDVDGYNHQGTDYFLWPHPWDMVNNDDVEIISSAPGWILLKNDGNYDTNCGEGGTGWNAVYIQHEDGSESWYGHMKEGSLTTKNVGEYVERGEYLGIVASSGWSTGPHLHFELWHYNPVNGLYSLKDPYFGNCNVLSDESLWEDQHNYYEPNLVHLDTEGFTTWWMECPTPALQNKRNYFTSEDYIFSVGYYRDIPPGTTASYKIFNPNNIQVDSYNLTITEYYSASWWWWGTLLNEDNVAGEYTLKIELLDQVYEHNFYFGLSGCTDSLADNYDPDAVFDDGSCSPCNGGLVEIIIEYDNYSDETHWTISDANNIQNYTTGLGWDAMDYDSFCASPGDYAFTIYDTYGDGMCCSEGDGSYEVYIDNELLVSGGNFLWEEITLFSIEENLPGDLNADSIVNLLDIIIIVNIILGNLEPDFYQSMVGDLNQDGMIDIIDIITMVNIILNN